MDSIHLKISSVDQYYGESHTLWSTNLHVPRGSRMCLMGRNGVGKTTLLRCVMGIQPVRAGSIVFDGVDITGLGAHARAHLGIGYVPQGREIFPRLTVEENLKVGLGQGRSKLKTIPDTVYELFPVLAQMRQRRGGDLSGGQQQQLAIGRALVLEPTLLILDEPTEGIQPNIVRDIGSILLDLNIRLKLTILLVEQKLSFARRVGDRFAIMDKGRIAAAGKIEQLDERLVSTHLSV